MYGTQKGFTLIEMLVVVLIMGVLTGSSLVGYLKFSKRQDVISTSKQFGTVLRTAQSRSSSGLKPPGINCPILVGYKVVGANGSSTYTLGLVCKVNETAASSTQIVRTYTLDKGVKFNRNVDITFLGLGGGVTSSDFSPITLSDDEHTYRIEVTTVGTITDKGIDDET